MGDDTYIDVPVFPWERLDPGIPQEYEGTKVALGLSECFRVQRISRRKEKLLPNHPLTSTNVELVGKTVGPAPPLLGAFNENLVDDDFDVADPRNVAVLLD
jgi:hypothetical protein